VFDLPINTATISSCKAEGECILTSLRSLAPCSTDALHVMDISNNGKLALSPIVASF